MFVSTEPSQAEGGIFAAPIFGPILRAVFQGGQSRVYALLLAIIVLWVVAIATFGYGAFIIPLLAAVLGMFVIMFVITLGS